ncbi:Gamma-aminobutyric acid type B receptor subunit 1, partial [Trichoplax sp. H2]
ASTSISLDDKSTYPYYFRTSVTEQSYTPARVSFFKEFNWNKVGIVHSPIGAYPKLALLIQREMTKANVEVAVMETIDADAAFALNSLKQKDVRIILYVGFTIPARQLICQAYRKGYYGSRYVWWFPGWFRTGWWKISDASFNCTTDELFAVIRNSSFYTSAPIYSSSNTKGISGKTGTQFFNDLNKSLNYTFKSSAVADTIGGIYDAVWSLALGLNRTEHQLLSKNSSLNEFNYHNQKIRSVLVEELNKLSFYGVTKKNFYFASAIHSAVYLVHKIAGLLAYCKGPISFKNGSSRLGNVIIWQLQDSYKKVAFYDIVRNKLNIHNDTLKWQDGKPPQDRLIVIVVINTITAGAFIPFSIISCLGIVFSFVIIGFIVIKRHNRYIKMSSPNLNYCILFGCILCYASVMVNGMDSRLIGVKNRKYTCVA